MEPKRIVILGAGFGGLKTALELEKHCASVGDCEITLVDQRAEHVYTPLLYEAATGFLDLPAEQCPGELRAGVCIDFESYRTIIGAKYVHYVRGAVESVDVKGQSVGLAGGRTVPYDTLIIALGSETAYYNIPGLREFGFPLKSAHDAMRMRQAIHAVLAKYKVGVHPDISISIGGAGATGVELACELANFFGRLVRAGVVRREAVTIRLIEAGPRPLSMFNDTLRRWAQERLSQLGVRVDVDTAIVGVAPGKVTIAPRALREGEKDERRAPLKGEATIECDVLAWTGGIQPCGALANIDLQKGKKGHVLVDAMLRVLGQENIFAVGDCAEFTDPVSGKPVPALAQVADAQAATVAENIVRMHAGSPLVPFVPKREWPAVLPLGGKDAIASIAGLNLRSYPAFLLRKIVDLRYFLSILPLSYALRAFFRGAKVHLKND